MNLLDAALRFAAAKIAIDSAEHEALEAAAKLVETRAKNLIGVPHEFWTPLSPETLRRKDGVNTPLLETGELRSSIEHTVIGDSAFVGSNSDVAVFQELGTSRGIPPRSFLGHAASTSGEEVAKIMAQTIGGAIGAALAGRSIEMEILRLVGHALHEAKEEVSDFMDRADEEDRTKR